MNQHRIITIAAKMLQTVAGAAQTNPMPVGSYGDAEDATLIREAMARQIAKAGHDGCVARYQGGGKDLPPATADVTY